MAVEWKIIPNDGVTDHGNGSYSLPVNDSFCQKTYTIRYKNTDYDGSGTLCQCSKKFIQNGKTCEDIYTYGEGTDTGYHSLTCEGGSFVVGAEIPYTCQTKVNTCAECNNGEVKYGTVYKTVEVSYTANTGSNITDEDDYVDVPGGGTIKYKYSQAGGCLPPCEPSFYGVPYSWCSASLRDGTCVGFSCTKGDLSTLEFYSITADVDWLHGFTVYKSEGCIRAWCDAKDCDGESRDAGITIVTNRGTFGVTSTQHGCIEGCSKVSKGCCCYDGHPCD